MKKQPLTKRDIIILSLLVVATLAVVGYRVMSRPRWDTFDPAKLPGSPTVVAFSGEGCHWCVEQKKVFDILRPEYRDRVKLWTVDASQSYLIARDMDITVRYVPTIAFFDASGEVVDVYEGYVTVEQLRSALATLEAGQ